MDTTHQEPISTTGPIPVVETTLDPGKPQREPIDAEDRAMLIGVISVTAIVALAVSGWVALCTRGSDHKRQEKTAQVEACTKLPEGTAAFACIVQIDE